MKILLPTDGSVSSQAAARSVAERPWPAGTEVRVQSVVELILSAARALFQPPFTDSESLDTYRAEAMKRAQDAVAAAGQILLDANPSLKVTDSVDLPDDKTKAVILNEARNWRPDLIVVGSHGHGLVDRFVLGSTSEAISLHAECSVEVIRKRAN
jgi:nucleotide-binding universal stress UspA family protein